MAAVKPSNWMMKGQVVVSCNCDYGCPCNVNGRPSTGKCEGGWTWHIEQGAQGDVRLDGLNIGLYCNWPAAIIRYTQNRSDSQPTANCAGA